LVTCRAPPAAHRPAWSEVAAAVSAPEPAATTGWGSPAPPG